MKFKDLSLKAKFDAAVMSVFGNPSKIHSAEYEKDGEVAYVQFVKNKGMDGYHGLMRLGKLEKTGLLDFGHCEYKASDYGPTIVDISAVPEIIDTWQNNMEDAGWQKRDIAFLGMGAQHEAVAYKKGPKL